MIMLTNTLSLRIVLIGIYLFIIKFVELIILYLHPQLKRNHVYCLIIQYISEFIFTVSTLIGIFEGVQFIIIILILILGFYLTGSFILSAFYVYQIDKYNKSSNKKSAQHIINLYHNVKETKTLRHLQLCKLKKDLLFSDK